MKVKIPCDCWVNIYKDVKGRICTDVYAYEEDALEDLSRSSDILDFLNNQPIGHTFEVEIEVNNEK